MKTISIKSGSVEELPYTYGYNKYEGYGKKPLNFSLNRRKFIRSIGIGSFGLIIPSFFFSNKALAQVYDCPCYYQYQYAYPRQLYLMNQLRYQALLQAALQRFYLNQATYRVHQPTEGRIRLVNRDYSPTSGKLAMAVVGQGSIEDQDTLEYEIPERTYQDIDFEDGPSGHKTGSKNLVAWTRKDSKAAPFEVDA